MEWEEDFVVDASGLRCPEPLMVARNKMMDMNTGQVLKLIATDPSTSWDIPNYCNYLGHDLVNKEEKDKHYYYWIRKG
jgi:tRNA 2-thiouridine synthesizing protein A